LESKPRARGRVHVVSSRSGEILRALAAKAKGLKSIRIELPATAVELLMDGGKVGGATYLDAATGKLMSARAPAVLLATGGLGQVYAETTNPPEACGDGIAMAFRAGALLSDMEFVQFHPTVLYTPKGPRRLLPEALRERGAQLRNLELDRFMLRYHEAGDLAPADVISRAILTEIRRSRGEFVYLDFTSLNEEDIKRSFPHTYADCLESNIDISSDLVPVRPAAHFAIGGITTDLNGSTTLAGLYAAGEAAANGVHGANRLASNGLLEGLVYGARAAAAMKAGRAPASWPQAMHDSHGAEVRPETEDGPPTSSAQLQAIAAGIRRLMWDRAGIIRDGGKLYEAAKRLSAIRMWPSPEPNHLYYEAENLLEVARAIVSCALARKESRGAHYRADFPLRDDSGTARHSFFARDSNVFFGPHGPPAASVHNASVASR
ncbi:MAG: L-aspartate oxidase, partial [Terriglobia bacterium]